MTQMPRHSPTQLIVDRRRRPRPMLRSRSPARIVAAIRDRSSSSSSSRGRSRSRSRSARRRRSRSRSRYWSPSGSPRRPYSPTRPRRMLRSRSPLRRSRGSITAASEPPQYPFHPNETVMVSNDVTSVSFIMDGRCSIPGDGKLHRVTIAILPFTATIHHVVTPRVSFDAYLQVGSFICIPRFSIDTALLNSFVGSALFQMIAPTPSSLAFSPRSWTTNTSRRSPSLKLQQGTCYVALSASTRPSK